MKIQNEYIPNNYIHLAFLTCDTLLMNTSPTCRCKQMLLKKPLLLYLTHILHY